MKTEVIAIDYETTGFNPYKGDQIFAFVITDTELRCKIHRFDNTSERKNRVSREMFEKYHVSKYTKVAHNAKFEMGFTAMYFNGELPESTWVDTIIMSQILKNLLKIHKLEYLAKIYFRQEFPDEFEEWEHFDKEVKRHMTTQKRLLNNFPHRFMSEIIEPLEESGVTPLVRDRPNYGLIPVDVMRGYQKSDGVRCMLLWLLMWPKLREDKELFKDFLNEMRLLKTAQKMEQFGMMVHERNSRELIRELKEKLTDVNNQKMQVFGFDINFDSNDQLQKHLFGHVNPKKHENLNDEWKRREPVFYMQPVKLTDGGAPSAGKEELLELKKLYPKNKGLDLILRHRSWSKGITMIESYLESAGENLIIHPTMNTNQARTGRQSVSNPNLQNVSKTGSRGNEYAVPARVCFRPRPNCVYFLGDYAGIEMRLIIDASGEKYLIEMLNEDMDYDVHSYNGEIILGSEFTGEKDKAKFKLMRANVKDATFGRAYGANIMTFARALKKTASEVKEGWHNFAEKCPGIFNFTRDMMAEVRNTGYITTAFGRKLAIERGKEYTASNYRIQGDAAGILKRAQNNTDEYLRGIWDYEVRMLLTVHDEIIIEMPRYLLRKSVGILHDISYCMTNIPEIRVPLGTEWKMTTTNWHDAKGFEI